MREGVSDGGEREGVREERGCVREGGSGRGRQ